MSTLKLRSKKEEERGDGEDYHPSLGFHSIQVVEHYRSFSAEACEGDEAEQAGPKTIVGHSEEVSDCRGESCHDIPFHLKYTIQWFGVKGFPRGFSSFWISYGRVSPAVVNNKLMFFCCYGLTDRHRRVCEKPRCERGGIVCYTGLGVEPASGSSIGGVLYR